MKQLKNNYLSFSYYILLNHYKLKPYTDQDTHVHNACYRAYLKHSLKFRCVLEATSLLQLRDHRCFSVITG